MNRHAPLLLALLTPLAAAQGIERVSLGTSSAPGDSVSWETTISGDGRKVAFVSLASNLVPADNNGVRDAFVHDRLSRSTRRVSVSSAGVEADDLSGGPAVSADGRWVAYYAWATNLVPGDTNGVADVFLHELESGSTTRVSVGTNGAQGDGDSQLPGITPSASFVVFSSDATTLVPGDTNGQRDVFVYERATGEVTRVSVASDGTQSDSRCDGAAISDDGRWVTYVSSSGLLVNGDDNGKADVFLRDRTNGVTTRVSLAPGGIQGDDHSGFDIPTGFVLTSISGDGRFIGFHSYATNLVAGDTNGVIDAFVHDTLTGTTERISVDSFGNQADGWSVMTHSPAISKDGRFAAFHSVATNLVDADTNGVADVFVRDRLLGRTTRASVGPAGEEGDAPSTFGVLSQDGAHMSFHSLASNFDPADTNGLLDPYAVDFLDSCFEPETYCTAKANSLGCVAAITTSGQPSLSGAGFTVSAAPILNDTLGILIYSTLGQNASPFQGGTLCVLMPARTGSQFSGGTPPPANDCSGTLALDFVAFANVGDDPGLLAGQPVWAQFWSRDPGFAPPNGSNLSDAVLFRLCP